VNLNNGYRGRFDGVLFFSFHSLNTACLGSVVSTTVGDRRAINKLQWDRRRPTAALGGSDGRLYVYDIGDMALPRESEWTDMQRRWRPLWATARRMVLQSMTQRETL